MLAETENINSVFCHAGTVDLTLPGSIEGARNILDEISQDLINDVQLRQQMGVSEPSIWPVLHKLWQITVEAQADERSEHIIKHFIPSLVRFTRNLVAAVPYNQIRAFESEPRIRALLFTYTSFYATEDESTYSTTLLLVQALSNIITSNEDLLPRLWNAYLSVPEEQSIMIRTLGSPDTRTILSVFVLILNCIHGSQERALLLTTKPLGLRICITLLHRMVSLHDVEESSDGGKAFEIGYRIFSKFIDFGVVEDLYTRISIDDEIITPHQTVLLKLLDSHLQTSPLTVEICQQLSPMIASTFFDLIEYADRALERALPPEQSPSSALPSLSSTSSTLGIAPPPSTPVTPPGDQGLFDTNAVPTANSQSGDQPLPEPTQAGELDMILPQVCEALVLLTQCLITLALTSEDSEFDFPPGDNPKDFFNSAMVDDGHGLAEALISLLRRLDRFLPRILFGKPIDLSSLPLPAGMRHAEFPSTNGDPVEGDEEEDAVPVKRGFAYLKRDLVRLLGILCWQDKSVQDRIRSCGGIPVVMNLCVVDERNPYLREHAIFALHNLLEDNLDNQNLVNQIQPISSRDGTVSSAEE